MARCETYGELFWSGTKDVVIDCIMNVYGNSCQYLYELLGLLQLLENYIYLCEVCEGSEKDYRQFLFFLLFYGTNRTAQCSNLNQTVVILYTGEDMIYSGEYAWCFSLVFQPTVVSQTKPVQMYTTLICSLFPCVLCVMLCFVFIYSSLTYST